jgi:anti-repressor protein
VVSTGVIPFEFHGNRVRVLTIDDSLWFVAADVCAVLELGNPRSSLALLDDDEKDVHGVDTPGGMQQMVIVSEPGLFSLILRSRKPEAKQFKRWVTHVVLPAIRKTGSYGTVRELSRLELIDLARDSELGRLKAEAERDALVPAAHSWETLAEASGDYSLREAAQILDRDPAIHTGQNRLARSLREFGWADTSGEPYQRHVDAGRLVRRPRSYDHPLTGESMATSQLRITVKGVHELHRLLGGTGPVLLEVA